MSRTVTKEKIKKFETVLGSERVTATTAQKYVKDVERFASYMNNREVTRDEVEQYISWLIEDRKYKKNSVNSWIASLNRFFRMMHWENCEIRSLTIDNSNRDLSEKYISRKDYAKLVETALEQRNFNMAMMIQTLCHVNLRFTELKYLTVESVKKGIVIVYRRQKEIRLKIPEEMTVQLVQFAEHEDIQSGVLFRTRQGTVPDRSNMWRRIKELCEQAGVDTGQVSLVKIKMFIMSDYYPIYQMPDL